MGKLSGEFGGQQSRESGGMKLRQKITLHQSRSFNRRFEVLLLFFLNFKTEIDVGGSELGGLEASFEALGPTASLTACWAAREDEADGRVQPRARK